MLVDDTDVTTTKKDNTSVLVNLVITAQTPLAILLFLCNIYTVFAQNCNTPIICTLST